MKYQPGSFYHIFNRGNNKQTIFFTDANYQFFITKVKKETSPFTELLAYCLMPNHFHFMLFVKDLPEDKLRSLTRKIGTLQSSYTRAINIQENRTGSLFQQQTKSVEICSIYDYQDDTDYLETCFHYIHQNPVKAGLVKKLEDWRYSSFNEYLGESNNDLINIDLAKEHLNISWENFYNESYQVIDDDLFF